MCDYLLGLEIEIIRHLEKLRKLTCSECTDKQENKIFLIYKEIQNGAGAK